jgi:ADP-ribosylglycohydrolase
MKQGGDTDTNCAIIGCMLGSIIGFKGLPPNYINKVINL